MRALPWLGIGAALAFGGCAWVPDAGQYEEDRGVVPRAVQASFVPGHTSRADVLCQLGEPDWVSPDEARFVYRVRIISSFFFIYLVGGLGMEVFGTLQSHLFAFDAQGRLVAHRVVEQSHSAGGDGGPGPLWSTPLPPDEEMEALFRLLK